MTPEQKRAALESIVVEVNTGLVDDDECARRLDEIGATDEGARRAHRLAMTALAPPRIGLVPKHQRGQLAHLRLDRWIGAREGGPPGQTQNALAARGVAETRVSRKPYERQVARLTELGALYLETHDPTWRANEAALAQVARISADRVAAGVCRHCGGPVPCWSPFGDVLVGVRRVE